MNREKCSCRGYSNLHAGCAYKKLEAGKGADNTKEWAEILLLEKELQIYEKSS